MAARIRRARLAAARAMAIGRRLVISRSVGPTGTFLDQGGGRQACGGGPLVRLARAGTTLCLRHVERRRDLEGAVGEHRLVRRATTPTRRCLVARH